MNTKKRERLNSYIVLAVCDCETSAFTYKKKGFADSTPPICSFFSTQLRQNGFGKTFCA